MVYLLILLLVAALGFALMTRTDIPACGTCPQVIDFDSGPGADPGTLPRVIWTYWHSSTPPLVVERCLRNWQALNPGYTIHLVSRESMAAHVAMDQLPAAFDQQSPARQSDWLRLHLLARHGGIWLDASIILTQPLDWLLEAQSRSRAQLVGFFLGRYTVDPAFPVVESWCLAAPPGSRFVSDWIAEFSGASFSDTARYLESLGDAPTRATLLQKIASPLYMAVHVSAQVVLRRGRGYRLHLIRSEDSAYFLQTRSGRWKRAGLFAFLLFFRHTRHAPPLIKLRGGERKKLEPWLQRGLYTPRSIVGTLLGRAVTKG